MDVIGDTETSVAMATINDSIKQRVKSLLVRPAKVLQHRLSVAETLKNY